MVRATYNMVQAMMKPLELTFAILKPHVISHPFAVLTIRNMILASDFKIVRSKRKTLTQEDAAKFYAEHKGKFFYGRLTGLMTSGPSELYILAKENAIADWRKLMGPTKVFKTQFEAPDSIRGLFGLSDTRNATHGSDSPQSVRREIGILFPEFNIDKWYVNEEPRYRKGEVEYCDALFCHFLTLKNDSRKDVMVKP